MKTILGILALVMMLCAFGQAHADTTISYSYDQNNRLVKAEYSESQQMFYNYDAADNMTLAMAITDAQYLKSFMLYLSLIDPVSPYPATFRCCVYFLAAMKSKA